MTLTALNPFLEISAILGLATILSIVGQKLRQPLIIMFLATGILAGPACLGIVASHDQIALLANIGISLLLFIVGLKLDLNLIRTTGPVALATGVGQIVFTSAIGMVLALAIGMPWLHAVYVSVALTFSSTIIIVKLLSDKKEIDSLHGQIAVGFLIVQDIAAILALVLLTTFGATAIEDVSVLESSLLILAKGIGLLALVAVLMRFVLPGLLRRLAQSQELLVLFSIAWAVLMGAGSELLGFSKEVGAFLAGISLASTSYRDAIGARLVTLRDFLLLFFFIDLGARLDWSTVGSQVGPAALFSVFVLIGNPIIVLVIMGLMGYRRRTGLLAGLTVAQISEFSLIVAALGLGLGHITAEIMGLITLVGVLTIFASTYMILYSGPLYRLLANPLKIFERRHPFREAVSDSVREVPFVDVILVGLGNFGSGVAEDLLRRGKTIIGVDFDPLTLEKWRARGISVLYGDMSDPELLDHLPLNKARWVASTVRARDLNLTTLSVLTSRGYEGKVALTAVNQQEAELYEKAGAQVVFRPFSDAAEQAADALSHAMGALPMNIDWPVAFREVRIRSDSAFAGYKLMELPLRTATGVSILAVSRAGQLDFDPGPEYHVYPGDRLLLMGQEEGIQQAEKLLDQPAIAEEGEQQFAITELDVSLKCRCVGETLSALKFRQRYGVTVAFIHRDGNQFAAPQPDEILRDGDRLIVIGSATAIEKLKQQENL